MKQILIYMLTSFMMIILTIIFILISVAFLTLFERKILSYSHYRKGPNKVGFMGLLQPFSDAMKLLTKEFFFPNKSNYYYYLLSPILMFLLIMMMWFIFPHLTNFFNFNLNILFILCVMSIGVYSLMISGWSSNSSFSIMGSIRSIAQSLSYEVIFSISILMFFLLINSLNLNKMFIYSKYLYFFNFIWPISIMLLISMMAEINRTPFDLSEGESELVSGFNVEYSNYGFTLIFLSEYSSIMFMMFLFNIMNFYSNLFNIFFYLTMIFMLFFIIWTRMTLPRIRYDYLMFLCWIYLLPLTLILFMFYLLNFKFSLIF